MARLISRFQQFRRGSPLSFRLLAYILLFSTAFSLIAAGLQVYTDFRKDVSVIDDRFRVIEASYRSSLSRSLWALDQNLLQIQLEGILSLPDIVHLRLRIYPDSELVLGERPVNGTAIRQYRLEIVREGTPKTELGELIVTASLERTYADLRQRLWVIFTTHFFKTFLLAVVIM